MASGIRSSPGSARIFSSRVAPTDLGELANLAQLQRQTITIAQTITSVLVTAATSPPAFGEAVTKLNDACHRENNTAGNSAIKDARTLPIAIPLNHQNPWSRRRRDLRDRAE
jgi:hypothetical protein